MVTIAIMAIFASIAVPSFIAFINSSRLTNNVNNLMSDFMMARTEASARGVRVVVCPAESATACSTSSAAWSSGRLVFSDANGNGTFDAGDTMLKYVSGITRVVITPSEFTNELAIGFSSFGGLVGAKGSFTICLPSGAGPKGRSLGLDMSGRPIAKRMETCS